jgi:hypothetical protein
LDDLNYDAARARNFIEKKQSDVGVLHTRIRKCHEKVYEMLGFSNEIHEIQKVMHLIKDVSNSIGDIQCCAMEGADELVAKHKDEKLLFQKIWEYKD